MCVQEKEGWIEGEIQGTGGRVYESRGKGRQANSSHVAFHWYHSPRPLLPYFMLHLSLYPSLLSSSLPLCLITLLFTWRSWPLHCSAGSQAVKPSQGEGCKSVSPSQEISWSSADSTKPSWCGGPNVSHTCTDTHVHGHTHTQRNSQKCMEPECSTLHMWIKPVCVHLSFHTRLALFGGSCKNKQVFFFPVYPNAWEISVCMCVCVCPQQPQPPNLLSGGVVQTSLLSLYFLSSPLLFSSTSLSALLHLILSASIPEMAQIAAEAKLPVIKHLQ